MADRDLSNLWYDDLVPIAEVREALGLTKSGMRTLLTSEGRGGLPEPFHLGRNLVFYRREIDAYLAERAKKN